MPSIDSWQLADKAVRLDEEDDPAVEVPYFDDIIADDALRDRVTYNYRVTIPRAVCEPPAFIRAALRATGQDLNPASTGLAGIS